LQFLSASAWKILIYFTFAAFASGMPFFLH